jgi:hypothetical protein
LPYLQESLAFYVTPREEEPQIVLPAADVYVHFPGASAQDVENLVWQVYGQPDHTYGDVINEAEIVRDCMEREYSVVDVDDTIEAE